METNVAKKRIQRLIVAILTVALVLTTFSLMPAASQIANPDSDNGIAYAAAKKVKVTYKANGGKFTAKKYAKKKSYSKKIKKGKKIGALPKIKRSGYTLKGWYTKKSGGKKVTKNTKVKKNTTYYAQWKKGSSSKSEKKSRTLTTEEKKLVGEWRSEETGGTGGTTYTFKKDGTFNRYTIQTYYGRTDYRTIGDFSLKNGVLYLTGKTQKSSSGLSGPWSPFTEEDDTFYNFTFNKDENGEFFEYNINDPKSGYAPYWMGPFYKLGK